MAQNILFRPIFVGILFSMLAAIASPRICTAAAPRLRGRLPPHYTKIVTDEQRQKIYALQEEYRPRIEDMESRLEALKKERDKKISAVLTPEQRKAVENEAVGAKKRKEDEKVKAAATLPLAKPAAAK